MHDVANRAARVTAPASVAYTLDAVEHPLQFALDDIAYCGGSLGIRGTQRRVQRRSVFGWIDDLAIHQTCKRFRNVERASEFDE